MVILKESVLFFFVAVFGLCVGSFLNVCIYRIPLGKSVVFPASHCFNCGANLRWYHNLPLLSYIVLRGRCSFCLAPFSWRYPFVEALNALLYLVIVYYAGFSIESAVLFLFVSALLVITFIDVDHQIIPDVISLPGIVLGVLCSFFLPWLTWQASLLGALLGGGSLFVVAYGYEVLAKKEGMGGGDIKLLAMIGAFCGWKAVLPIIFISSLLGTVVGVPLMIVNNADSKLAIPFGPFLALATVIYLFWGDALVRWYFELVGL